jgi:hypothetical protein
MQWKTRTGKFVPCRTGTGARGVLRILPLHDVGVAVYDAHDHVVAVLGPLQLGQLRAALRDGIIEAFPPDVHGRAS